MEKIDKKITIEYIQEADCNSKGEQILTLSTSDCGGGVYYILETERWAFDTLEELIEVLEDFKLRATVQIKKEEGK
jgi:folate-binding Fe-S cluster repair protein YgfZ